mmetsp:Transcript_21748/g.38441  ORF Transcript_21748/g.38441 Transcript_21748/m.38441 type:complete len:242 (+) Transcript_21748:381-1106(+)
MFAVHQGFLRLVELESDQCTIGPRGRVICPEVDAPSVVSLCLIPILRIKSLVAFLLLGVGHVLPVGLWHARRRIPYFDRRCCLHLILLFFQVIEVASPCFLRLVLLLVQLCLELVDINLVPRIVVVLHLCLVSGTDIFCGPVILQLGFWDALLLLHVRSSDGWHCLLASDWDLDLGTREVVPNLIRDLFGFHERCICLLDGGFPVQKVLHGIVHFILGRFLWVHQVIVLWRNLQQLVLACP